MAENQQNGRDSSPNDVAKQNMHKVRDAVKSIQTRESVLTSPVPKPRRFSPASSPTLSTYKIPSPVPERVKLEGSTVTPPSSPMRRRSEGFKNGVGDSRPKPPIRKRRKKFATDDNDVVGTNRNSGEVGVNRYSMDPSDYVNLSFSEGNMDLAGEGEKKDGETVTKGATLQSQQKVAAEGGEGGREGREGGAAGENSERGRFESFVVVAVEEGARACNVASPDIVSVPEEGEYGESDGKQRASSDPSSANCGTASPDDDVVLSPITTGTSPSDSQSPVATETVAEGDVSTRQPVPPQQQTRFGLGGSFSVHQSGKKKPPPLPAPYQSRPPPVPTKLRSVRRQHTEPATATDTVADGNGSRPIATATTNDHGIPTAVTTAPTPTDTGAAIMHRQLSLGSGLQPPRAPPPRPPSPQRLRKSSPNLSVGAVERQGLSPPASIREGAESPGTSSGGSGVVSPLTPGNSVEVRVLTSRPDTMPKHLSSGSSDSLELSESISNRHSTIGVSRLKPKVRSLPSGKPHLKGTRPLSDASLNLLDGYDVLLPAGHLQDVMKSVITNDERMQEANIYEVVQACMKAMPHVTSTRELPPLIPGMPTDTRSKVIHELYTTEYTYVHSLETLSEVFKDPLATVLGEESGRIFANVDDILAFNKGFLALLHSRLSSWTPESLLGDLFIGMFTQSHRSMYAIYCSNYDSAELLLHHKKKKKEFEQQLSVCLQNPRVMHGLTLAAYLITPVQRVPRYILLLKDIIQRTPDDHPDYHNLLTAKAAMGELADYIDAQIRESQTKKTFDSLKNKVVGLADLESRDRSLVKEGQCFLKNIKKLYQCILFNDLLVFAHGDSRQSKVQLQLSLEGVWVEDLEDLDPQTSNQDAIEIYTPDRPYTVYTQTSSEKKLWLTKLRETIYQLLLKDGKCTRSSGLDTDQRTATFVYTDGRLYTGNFTCARRHGKGTMVWPDSSKYIGDWVYDERHGEGQFTFNTREVYDGRWVEDRITGYGKMTFASDDKYIGYWKDGTRHGRGKIVYSNRDFFEGNFKEGQIEGEGTLRCRNGLEYIGHWKHSQRHGHGRLRTVLGNTYDGEFSRNQIHGTGRMTYCNGDCYDGQWKAGTVCHVLLLK
ncbi:Alsin [Geodia barretti]|uniref:Alsin n=2 Tax=Geodia barretti TaxID=519541 RepID=A0AA35WLB4_GEOBA|nr:Alsin [Geodia barretti]